MDISPLTSEHYPEAVDLWVATWREEMPHLDFESRRGWLLGHLDELVSGGAKLLGAFGGGLLGFVSIKPDGYVDQLAVSVAAKGRGVADALLAAARQHSPDRLELDVNEHNPRARRFYERQGFFEIGRSISERSGLPLIKLRWLAGDQSQQAQQQ